MPLAAEALRGNFVSRSAPGEQIVQLETGVQIAAILIGALLAFVAFWLGVLKLLGGLSGWSALGKIYATQPIYDPAVYTIRLTVGIVNYSVAASGFLREGIYMAVPAIFRSAHPAVLIPWSDLEPPKVVRGLLQNLVEFRERSTGARLLLSTSQFEKLRQASTSPASVPAPRTDAS